MIGTPLSLERTKINRRQKAINTILETGSAVKKKAYLYSPVGFVHLPYARFSPLAVSCKKYNDKTYRNVTMIGADVLAL